MARRSTRRYVEKLAKRLGVEVEIDADRGIADAWSPKGKVFEATYCHTVAHHFHPGPWMNEVYGALAEDLELGLAPCDNEPCDVCQGQ